MITALSNYSNDPPWNNMVREMAMSAVIQKHTNLPTTLASTNPRTIVKSIILPSTATTNNSIQMQAQGHMSSTSLPQGYIALNSLVSQASTLPMFAQNITGGAQVFQGTPITLPQLAAATGQFPATPDLASQTSVVHLAPVGYAPSTMDGSQLFQQGFW